MDAEIKKQVPFIALTLFFAVLMIVFGAIYIITGSNVFGKCTLLCELASLLFLLIWLIVFSYHYLKDED